MKKIILFTTILLHGLTFANASTFDYIYLENGDLVQGHIVKIGSNRIKIKIDEKNHSISHRDILGVVFGQEPTAEEKYKLGKLDGKRFAKNKTGNLLFGTVSLITGGLPILLIYATSKQSPHSDGITEKNKLIIDDEHYLKGYKRGAKSTSTWEAVKGGLIGTGALFLVAVYGMSQVP